MSKAQIGACQFTSPFIMFLVEPRAAVFILSLAKSSLEGNGELCLRAHHSGGGPQLSLAWTLARCEKITYLSPSFAGNRASPGVADSESWPMKDQLAAGCPLLTPSSHHPLEVNNNLWSAADLS